LQPVLLQICPNDQPPFAEICRYYETVARSLAWRAVTIMLTTRADTPEPDFHYLDEPFPALVERLLQGNRPALTLCHRYRAYRAALTTRRIVEPVVAVAHEFDLFRRGQRRLRRHWDRVCNRPDVVFAGVSDAVTADIRRRVGRAVLLPNGIDLARVDAFRLPSEAARRSLGLAAKDFNIGVIGRLHPKKNPELAVAGFRRAADRLGGARLVMMGDGELTARITAQAAEAAVSVKGFVPDAARLLGALDLLLIPSGGREAFGMVALEAMAARVPVLCGPSPGPGFVVGDAGLRFAAEDPDSLADALVDARTRQLRDEFPGLAEAGRERVERMFSVPAGARRLAELAAAGIAN
jgi:glycosyltransferase involved in cell wall biosynthesis